MSARTRPSARSFNFGDIWEAVAACVPTRLALVSPDERWTYAEVDERARGLAQHLRLRGIGAGDSVGIMMRNLPEHVVALLALYLLRARPVNVNYRLRAAELQYLIEDSSMIGLIIEPSFAEVVGEAQSLTAREVWTLETGDPFDSACASDPIDRMSVERSGDDPYLLYTGGTTGMPKGVLWRMEDAYFSCLGGGDPTGLLGPLDTAGAVTNRLVDDHAFLPAAPLMHAAGTWTVLRWLFAGSKVVLLPEFDPNAIWGAVGKERVVVMNIVGDAMARPLLDALESQPASVTINLSTVASGGAGLSARNRSEFLQRIPHLTIKDSYGSSETGVHGWAAYDAATAATSALPFTCRDTLLIDPVDGAPISAPGRRGFVARSGHVPASYWNDSEKSESTFRQVGGSRVAVTGDLGHWSDDGRLVLLGRGSQCINSGGEKIFPEEVETVLRDHPDVGDAIVIGVADPQWGQRVEAIVAVSPGQSVTAAELREYCRRHLASFKVPKRIHLTAGVQRLATGKPDYRWAQQHVAKHCSTKAADGPRSDR